MGIFNNKKEIEELKFEIKGINTDIITHERTFKELRNEYMKEIALLKMEINKLKNGTVKPSPFKNHENKGRKKEIKINPGKTYTVDQAMKYFGITRQTVCLRIRVLLKTYIDKDKYSEYFYKKLNGFKKDNAKGKQWVITSKGLKLLARSYNVEVVE